MWKFQLCTWGVPSAGFEGSSAGVDTPFPLVESIASSAFGSLLRISSALGLLLPAASALRLMSGRSVCADANVQKKHMRAQRIGLCAALSITVFPNVRAHAGDDGEMKKHNKNMPDSDLILNCE
jgi:hypothetical protein